MKIKQTVIYKTSIAFFERFKKFIPLKTAAEKEYYEENKKDKKENRFVNPITELAIKEFKKAKGVFGDFALAESSVRCFLYYLLQQKQDNYNICEFGGGQSTLLWNILAKYVNLTTTTYEHDPDWAQYLIGHIDNKKIRINYCELMQVNEENRERMFNNPAQSRDIFRDTSIKIDIEQYKNPTLKNGFYNIENSQFPNRKIDAIVLDGPHGNGRSICFPLFYNHIREGTIVLLDDYHHYPFLEDLDRLFEYEIFERRRQAVSGKGWIVLEIIKKRLLVY